MTVLDLARRLPGIADLREHCRALAMLEAVVSPEWASRYYSFNSAWAPGQQTASMRDGSGSEWSIVFSAAGAYIRGFDHESPMSPYASGKDGPWPGVVDLVPAAFREFVAEPAFCDERRTPVLTVCLWRGNDDDRWQTGEIEFPEGRTDPDGADALFGLLTDRTPEAYLSFAEDSYEMAPDLAAVTDILGHRPLTAGLVHAVNPEVTLEELAADVAEIGYPGAAQGRGR